MVALTLFSLSALFPQMVKDWLCTRYLPRHQ